MMQTVADLGKLVKSKYPGSYDDMPDADLGKSVKAKYPGAYDDFSDSPAVPGPAPDARTAGQVLWDTIKHPVRELSAVPDGGTAAALGHLANVAVNTAPGANDPTFKNPASAIVGAGVPGGPATGGMSLVEAAKNSPVARVASGAWSAVKGKVHPSLPPETTILERIAPSRSNAIMARDAATELAAAHPDLATVPAKDFDKALFQKFQDAGANVQAIEATIPDAMPVPRQPIVDGLTNLRDRFSEIGSDKAVKAINAQIKTIQNATANSPASNTLAWDQFIEMKRNLGSILEDSGVWKRLASDSPKAADSALAKAYGQFMEASNGISPELTAANQQFKLLHNAVRASDMETALGQRIGSIGKHIPTPFEKVKGAVAKHGPAAVKVGIGGAIAKEVLLP